MKEPKRPKFEDNKEQNEQFAFFKDGLLPEKNEIKKIKNKSSNKEDKRIPFSLPNNISPKKQIKTQNEEEDLLPYFAKDYPSSSESKEEICFINSPIPSETSLSRGEAEEVEGIEEEENIEKNKNSKKDKKSKENIDIQKNIINEESLISGMSVDYNSELEAEQDKPSSMLTRVEVLEMYNAQQEKNKMEQKKKEEEERRRKEEEEKRRKKEEEEKERREQEEVKRRYLEHNRKKMIEDEKRRQKEEQEKKMKIEMERKKREEEEMKKKLKSFKKNEQLPLLSSIKKNSDDNNIASNSMINEVNQIFQGVTGVIPEENSENEEDDYSKKNFKKSPTQIYPKKSTSKKKPIKNVNSKSKSKSKSKKKSQTKKVSNFNDKLRKSDKIEKNNKIKAVKSEEDDGETKETNFQKNKKKTSQSKKSNGLKLGGNKSKKSIKEEKSKSKSKSKKKMKFDDNAEDEDFSNYGDELQSSDSDKPKKEKIILKEVKKGKPQKKRSSKDKFKSSDLVALYRSMENVKLYYFDAIQEKEKDKEKSFGKDKRYSLRNRLKRLRPEIGERAFYVDYGNGPELQSIMISSNPYLGDSYLYNQSMKNISWEDKRENNLIKERKKKKKLLLKGKGIFNDVISEKEELDSDNLDSQNFSEYGEDDARFLKIPKNGKKNPAKNYDTLLIIKVHQAEGKNKIKVGDKEYKDLIIGDVVKVKKNEVYEILNYSSQDLIVQLLLDSEEK